jgi:hypothetical protein
MSRSLCSPLLQNATCHFRGITLLNLAPIVIEYPSQACGIAFRGSGCYQPHSYLALRLAHDLFTTTNHFSLARPSPRLLILNITPGICFLENPSPMDFHSVDTYSLLRGHKGYSVPDFCLMLNLGSHSSPGYFDDAIWIILRDVQFGR